MAIYEDNTKSIGHTPLVRINRLDAASGSTILAKIEGRNPAYSVKCRIGSAMIWDAEERGTLMPGMEHKLEPVPGIEGAGLLQAREVPRVKQVEGAVGPDDRGTGGASLVAEFQQFGPIEEFVHPNSSTKAWANSGSMNSCRPMRVYPFPATAAGRRTTFSPLR